MPKGEYEDNEKNRKLGLVGKSKNKWNAKGELRPTRKSRAKPADRFEKKMEEDIGEMPDAGGKELEQFASERRPEYLTKAGKVRKRAPRMKKDARSTEALPESIAVQVENILLPSTNAFTAVMGGQGFDESSNVAQNQALDFLNFINATMPEASEEGNANITMAIDEATKGIPVDGTDISFPDAMRWLKEFDTKKYDKFKKKEDELAKAIVDTEEVYFTMVSQRSGTTDMVDRRKKHGNKYDRDDDLDYEAHFGGEDYGEQQNDPESKANRKMRRAKYNEREFMNKVIAFTSQAIKAYGGAISGEAPARKTNYYWGTTDEELRAGDLDPSLYASADASKEDQRVGGLGDLDQEKLADDRFKFDLDKRLKSVPEGEREYWKEYYMKNPNLIRNKGKGRAKFVNGRSMGVDIEYGGIELPKEKKFHENKTSFSHIIEGHRAYDRERASRDRWGKLTGGQYWVPRKFVFTDKFESTTLTGAEQEDLFGRQFTQQEVDFGVPQALGYTQNRVVNTQQTKHVERDAKLLSDGYEAGRKQMPSAVAYKQLTAEPDGKEWEAEGDEYRYTRTQSKDLNKVRMGRGKKQTDEKGMTWRQRNEEGSNWHGNMGKSELAGVSGREQGVEPPLSGGKDDVSTKEIVVDVDKSINRNRVGMNYDGTYKFRKGKGTIKQKEFFYGEGINLGDRPNMRPVVPSISLRTAPEEEVPWGVVEEPVKPAERLKRIIKRKKKKVSADKGDLPTDPDPDEAGSKDTEPTETLEMITGAVEDLPDIATLFEQQTQGFLKGYSGSAKNSKFDSLEEAQVACIANPMCGGITYQPDFKNKQYTTRLGGAIRQGGKGEATWLKKV